VNRLLKQFADAQKMMKMMAGGKGLQNVLGMQAGRGGGRRR
jgi:signal recognition particle GTPase